MAIHVLTWDETPPAECRGGAVAIGNFDGVHRGHVALLTALRRQAQSFVGPGVALTFDPHPLQLLRPAQFQPVLTTVPERAELLLAKGADAVVILKTTPELLHLSAADFFEQVIRRRLQARALAEGDNFGFGRDREGDVHTLAELCKQAVIGLEIVPPLLLDDIPVSSSRVRHALERGDVREAASLLGRLYWIGGTVGTGRRRGHTLGFPTANLEAVETLIPGDGVYAVRAAWQGQTWPGAANIGPNPTFGEQACKVEIHLIGFQGDLYGQLLHVDFLDRLRDTQPFPNVEQLVRQLRQDVEQARQIAGV